MKERKSPRAVTEVAKVTDMGTLSSCQLRTRDTITLNSSTSKERGGRARERQRACSWFECIPITYNAHCCGNRAN